MLVACAALAGRSPCILAGRSVLFLTCIVIDLVRNRVFGVCVGLSIKSIYSLI